MTLLTVNTGSSSSRLAGFRITDTRGSRRAAPRVSIAVHVASARFDRNDEPPQALIRQFLGDAMIGNQVSAVAHRVVHGGVDLTDTCLIDPQVEREIDRLSNIAPLHNPVALEWIRASKEMFGHEVPQIAVFDTAFFASLPPVAATYALPRALSEEHDLRRYGFHGLAHQAMWRGWRDLQPELDGQGRVITVQLGAGCSIAAIEQGRPKDTSMGFSPLEGLVMATRTGDLDPGLVTYLQRQLKLLPAELERILNNESGLLGVSGTSGDMRVLLESKDPASALAVSLYCYRVRKYIGSYLGVLGGADALLFGGGVGENAPAVRGRILKDWEWAGIEFDEEANAAAGKTFKITRDTSLIEAWVVPVDESAVLAEEALNLLAKVNN